MRKCTGICSFTHAFYFHIWFSCPMGKLKQNLKLLTNRFQSGFSLLFLAVNATDGSLQKSVC